ncbi:MAG: hypothetical protein P8Y97_19785 [Candidatus Lokiarchaeota archaeon]
MVTPQEVLTLIEQFETTFDTYFQSFKIKKKSKVLMKRLENKIPYQLN